MYFFSVPLPHLPPFPSRQVALSTYEFPCANIITLMQLLCSLALLTVLRRLKVMSDNKGLTGCRTAGLTTVLSLIRSTPTVPI